MQLQGRQCRRAVAGRQPLVCYQWAGWGEALVNPHVGETVREVLDNYVRALSPVIHKAQETGQIDKSLDPRSVSQLLLSVYYGLELQLALDPNLDVDKYAAAAKALLSPTSPAPPE